MNQGEDFHRIEGPIEESASEERENQIADRQNINSRTKELTKLLCNYVETYRSRVRQSNELRDNFYLISVSLLIFLSVGFPLVILCLLWCGKIADVNAAVGLISSCAVIATSVIVLPKTIAEYLFSTEEDSKNADIVKEIIKSDLEIRNKLKEENISDDLDGGSY